MEPKSEGVAVVWFCCVLVLPNKEGVVEVCCVEAPLKDVVSLSVAKASSVHTTAMAWPAGRLQRALPMVLLQLVVVFVC